MNKIIKLLDKTSISLRHPDEENLIDYYDALIELQQKVNSILDIVQPRVYYPRADELSLIRYHERFSLLIDEIVRRASKDCTKYRFYLTPGHPESERLHSLEIKQLKDLGYKVRITIDDDYEAVISW